MYLDNSSCRVPLALEIVVRYGVCCRLCPHPYRCNEYRNADVFTSVVGGGGGWGRMGPSPQAPEFKGRQNIYLKLKKMIFCANQDLNY